jgi:hypothetical protein
MIDLMRRLLDLRETLQSLDEIAGNYGLSRQMFPQIGQMQQLEREAFKVVEEWEKPDPPCSHEAPIAGIDPRTDAQG